MNSAPPIALIKPKYGVLTPQPNCPPCVVLELNLTEEMNMRRTLLAIGAAAALAVAALPSTASAQYWGGGHFGHHYGFGGPRIGIGFGVAPYAYDEDYGPGCYRAHRVWTRFGWRIRRAWVC